MFSLAVKVIEASPPPPPLPPSPDQDEKPPLPPEAEKAPPPPPPPASQVEDMELSDEEESNTIIETKEEDNDHLTDVLSSFYSDLANIDGSASQDATPIPTPPKVDSPGPSFFARETSPALSDERSQSPSSIGDTLEERRRRKVFLQYFL